MMSQSSLNSIVLIIPAYEPSDALRSFISDLNPYHFQAIIIINDGSSADKQALFEQLKSARNVTLIDHDINRGKGAAIKTAIHYILENLSEKVKGIVTADADGQHLAKDVVNVARATLQHSQQYILGERAFGKDVPFRSKFGNSLTRKLFAWFYRSKLRDTQTGLRGMALPLARALVDIPYDGYEFELECLIESKRAGFSFKSVDVETVYIDDNASSHFNPIVDSAKIYFVFFRYLIVALLSFAIDFVVFILLHFFLQNIFMSLLAARIISGAFNFYQNKYNVYKVKDKAKIRKEIIEYIVLALIIFCCSYLFITVLHRWAGLNVILSKIISDAILFSVSFIVQKVWVF